MRKSHRSPRFNFRFLTLCLLLLLFNAPVFAAKVDTVEVYSQAMNKSIKAVVITPDGDESDKYPVVYLLHGYGGDYANWINKVPKIQAIADKYSLIIVCPDGNNSWYWDSPVDKNYRYETFVSEELVNWVDKNYDTYASRNARAITGLSMGGHGALYLAFKHQDVFGAAGSMSGGVDIRPFPLNWEISKRMGAYSEFPQRWENNTVTNMLYLLQPESLKLIIDCGTSDFFYEVNQQLHKKLLLRNIPHTYITRPGRHNWDYWEQSIDYQLLFMHNYFEESMVLEKDLAQ